jgi:hypothetical protein
VGGGVFVFPAGAGAFGLARSCRVFAGSCGSLQWQRWWLVSGGVVARERPRSTVATGARWSGTPEASTDNTGATLPTLPILYSAPSCGVLSSSFSASTPPGSTGASGTQVAVYSEAGLWALSRGSWQLVEVPNRGLLMSIDTTSLGMLTPNGDHLNCCSRRCRATASRRTAVQGVNLRTILRSLAQR